MAGRCVQEEGGHSAAAGRRGHGAHEESRLEVRFHVRAAVLPALRDVAAAAAAAAEQRHDADQRRRGRPVMRNQRALASRRALARP